MTREDAREAIYDGIVAQARAGMSADGLLKLAQAWAMVEPAGGGDDDEDEDDGEVRPLMAVGGTAPDNYLPMVDDGYAEGRVRSEAAGTFVVGFTRSLG